MSHLLSRRSQLFETYWFLLVQNKGDLRSSPRSFISQWQEKNRHLCLIGSCVKHETMTRSTFSDRVIRRISIKIFYRRVEETPST